MLLLLRKELKLRQAIVLPTTIWLLKLLVLKLLVTGARFTKMLLSSPPATAAVSTSFNSMGFSIAFPHCEKPPRDQYCIERLGSQHPNYSKIWPAPTRSFPNMV